jgi:hypothetical protein
MESLRDDLGLLDPWLPEPDAVTSHDVDALVDRVVRASVDGGAAGARECQRLETALAAFEQVLPHLDSALADSVSQGVGALAATRVPPSTSGEVGDGSVSALDRGGLERRAQELMVELGQEELRVQEQLLGRPLKVRPAVGWQLILGATDHQATRSRERVHAARRKILESYRDRMVEVVDTNNSLRESPPEPQDWVLPERFLRDCLTECIADQALLESELGEIYPGAASPLLHTEHALARAGRSAPMRMEFDAFFEGLTRVLPQRLGISCVPARTDAYDNLVRLRLDVAPLGHAAGDVVVVFSKAAQVSHTYPLIARPAEDQRALALAVVVPWAGRGESISLRSAISTLHELGHGIEAVVRAANVMGGSPSPHHRETLSLWCEQLIEDPCLGVSETAPERRGLSVALGVGALERRRAMLLRVVEAVVDQRLRATSASVLAILADIERETGFGRWLDANEVLRELCSAPSRWNAEGLYTYLWARAASGAAPRVLETRPLAEWILGLDMAQQTDRSDPDAAAAPDAAVMIANLRKQSLECIAMLRS